MIWNEKMECKTSEQTKEIQLAKLQKTVKRVYENVPMYRGRLDKIGLTPDKVNSLDVLRHVPFTTKQDLREHYPFGLFAAPMDDIVRIHGSSGTTGKPTIVSYTKRDLDMWSECMARIITMAGGCKSDIVQIAFGYGLFTGAFGLHQGMEKIGATVVPMSSGNTEKQLMLMQDFGTTVLIATPSYALYMTEVMQEMGIKKEDLKLKAALVGAEGSTLEMRMELARRFGIDVTENYGMSELVGPGVSGECLEHSGLHINDDMFIAEIIDPETGEVLPVGEEGELVITTIDKEAFPLLRYRTRDITRLIPEPCKCGRTTMRMEAVKGRSDDMLIIKGVNVFPTQVESVIVTIPEVSPNYQLVVDKKGFTDMLQINVELVDGSLLDSFGALEKLEKDIRHKLHTVLGLEAKINLMSPKSIERSTGKAKRVIDLRKQK